MIRKVLLAFLLIIIFKIVSCVYIEPNTYKSNYMIRYNKELNIRMNQKNIKITYYFDTGGNTGHIVEWIRTEKFKNDIITPERYYNSYRDEIPLNIHLVGENDYVGEKLVYDKSKGNHFKKIEEYLEKHKEEIFKSVLEKDWEKGIKIKFYTLILHKTDNNKYVMDKNFYEIKDNILRRIKNENFDFDLFYKERDLKEKEFFKKEIKYENIEWEKYIEYMGDYPVLFMEIEKKIKYSEEDKDIFNIFKEDYWISSYEFSIDDRELYEYEIRRKNAIQKIYKDIEKFYNKDTFTFVIRQF